MHVIYALLLTVLDRYLNEFHFHAYFTLYPCDCDWVLGVHTDFLLLSYFTRLLLSAHLVRSPFGRISAPGVFNVRCHAQLHGVKLSAVNEGHWTQAVVGKRRGKGGISAGRTTWPVNKKLTLSSSCIRASRPTTSKRATISGSVSCLACSNSLRALSCSTLFHGSPLSLGQ